MKPKIRTRKKQIGNRIKLGKEKYFEFKATGHRRFNGQWPEHVTSITPEPGKKMWRFVYRDRRKKDMGIKARKNKH